jgi:hypothetical protein
MFSLKIDLSMNVNIWGWDFHAVITLCIQASYNMLQIPRYPTQWTVQISGITFIRWAHNKKKWKAK